MSCAIIDSVLDFDYGSGRTDTSSADTVVAFRADKGYRVDWLLETHVHADHLSAAPYLQEKLGGKIGIGHNIKIVQDTFGKVFNEGTEFQRDGSQFDQLFSEGDSIHIGQLRVDVLHTPGHTPACLTYVIGDAAFVGDTLFMPDFGTARCDFPGGSADTMWDSVQKILALPEETRIFVGHDYKAEGPRPLRLGNHRGRAKGREYPCRRRQIARRFRHHAHHARREAEHAQADRAVAAGEHARRPDAEAEDNGTVYLKVPVNTL